MHAVHFFSLLEHRDSLPYCDQRREGDSWTTLAGDVTCPKCALLLAMIDVELAERSDRVEPATK
jgi:hypothetical protein